MMVWGGLGCFYGPVFIVLSFNFALCYMFSISSCTHNRHIWLFVLWIFWLPMQQCREIATGRVEMGVSALDLYK